MRSAGDAIWDMVSGLSRIKRERRPLVMLQAFFDDSGVGQPPVYCLCGAISSAKVWVEFSDEWQAMLDQGPTLTHWKTSNAMQFRGQFTYWDKADRDKRLSMACDIIERHEIMMVSCFMMERDFKTVLGSQRPEDGWHPYQILLGAMASQLGQYLWEKKIVSKIDFVFDDQQDQKKAVLAWWAEFASAAPPHYAEILSGTPVFKNDQDVLPLQAADLVAWHTRRIYADMVAGRPTLQLPWKSKGDGRCKWVQFWQTDTALRSMLLSAQIKQLSGDGSYSTIFEGELGGPNRR